MEPNNLPRMSSFPSHQPQKPRRSFDPFRASGRSHPTWHGEKWRILTALKIRLFPYPEYDGGPQNSRPVPLFLLLFSLFLLPFRSPKRS
jgi:hypothetical protein